MSIAKFNTKLNTFADLKSAYSETKSETLAPQSYDYGEMKSLSNGTDVSFLHTRGVYYLRDYKNKSNTATYHPYVIVSKKFYTNTGKVLAFGITSTPSSIDMVPIILDNGITYIDPHQFYEFNYDSIKSWGQEVKYIGDITNLRAYNIARDFKANWDGMDAKRSEEEVYEDYYDYCDDFFKRNHKYKPVLHKGDSKRELTVKFTTSRDLKKASGNTIDDVKEDPIHIQKNDITQKPEPVKAEELKSEQKNDMKQKPEPVKAEESKSEQKEKEKLIVDTNSQAVLSAIAALESQPVGSVILKRNIIEMTDDEKIIFLTYKKLNSYQKIQEFYNCSHGTISNRFNQLKEEYEIIYK